MLKGTTENEGFAFYGTRHKMLLHYTVTAKCGTHTSGFRPSAETSDYPAAAAAAAAVKMSDPELYNKAIPHLTQMQCHN